MEKRARGVHAPVFISRDRRTFLNMIFTRASARIEHLELPPLAALLEHVPVGDRVYFFVNRQTVVMRVAEDPKTHAKALVWGAQVVRSTNHAAFGARADARCGVSLYHEKALMDLVSK